MPGLRGPAKREYFNAIAGGLVYAPAAAGTAVCLLTFGPLGTLAGLACGAAAGGLLAERGRFFRALKSRTRPPVAGGPPGPLAADAFF